MSTHTTTFGIGHRWQRRAASLPLAGHPAQAAAPALPWLERLAAWAERLPRHHHLGSCARL